MPFEDNYPNIDRWVNEHEGRIEIGHNINSPFNSFIGAVDLGGMYWNGDSSYPSIDDALQDLDDNLATLLQELYGE